MDIGRPRPHEESFLWARRGMCVGRSREVEQLDREGLLFIQIELAQRRPVALRRWPSGVAFGTPGRRQESARDPSQMGTSKWGVDTSRSF